jgi:hypothetical protein
MGKGPHASRAQLQAFIHDDEAMKDINDMAVVGRERELPYLSLDIKIKLRDSQ